MAEGRAGTLAPGQRRGVWGQAPIALIFLGLCLLTWMTVGHTFVQKENVVNVARQVSMDTIIACGMTMVIIGGGIDLSVGSVVALSGVLGALVAKQLGGAPPAVMLLASIATAMAAGACCGAFSGFVSTTCRVPPFIATLAVMAAASGFAFIITGGIAIFDLPEGFTALGRGNIGSEDFPIPIPALIMLAVVGASAALLRFSTFGRHVYAVGGNEAAARLSGVNVGRVRLATHVITGLFAGLAGIILVSRLNSGDPKSGFGWELNVIAAVVVGGTSLMGGKGAVVGTFIGALVIGVLNNGLNLVQTQWSISPYWQKVALGAVILVAVLIDQMGKRKE